MIIWVAFTFLIFYLFSYHILNFDPNRPNDSLTIFIARFGLELSIVLIPVIIASSSFRKKFHENKNQLFHLKEKIINLRYEIAYKIINESEEREEDLLKSLEKFSNPLILNPLILDDIKIKIRHFKILRTSNSSYADVFSFISRGARYLDLYQIDLVLVEVIKLLKKYGDRKEYNNFREGYFGQEVIEAFKKEPNHEFVRKQFYRNVIWPIVYILFIFKPGFRPALFYYDKDFDYRY